MPKSILIVDDHEVVRRELRSLFKPYPEFSICGEAIHGVDAIEKAGELSPDLIILDLAMPEMNGLEAAAALRYMMPTVPLPASNTWTATPVRCVKWKLTISRWTGLTRFRGGGWTSSLMYGRPS